jgi:hypothetical protein
MIGAARLSVRAAAVVTSMVMFSGCDQSNPPRTAVLPCPPGAVAVDPECLLSGAPRLSDALYAFLTGPFATEQRFDFANMGYDARAHPSEAAVVFWSAYRLTRDPAFMQAGRNQLSYAASLVDGQGYFQWPYGDLGQFSSNTLARLALGFYLGFAVTGDPSDMELADRVAEALMRLEETLVRSSFTGQYYLLPYYVYRSPSEPEGNRSLDPNQDATLALLFTLLSAERESRLYRSPEALERAARYLSAAMDPLGLTGCWPLADQPDFREACDSLYNWWTLYQLQWINEVSPRAGLEPLLAAQYRVLRGDMLAGLSRRAYPVVSHGRMAHPTELWLALPAADRFGAEGDVTRIVQLIDEQASRYPSWADMPGGFVVNYGLRHTERVP